MTQTLSTDIDRARLIKSIPAAILIASAGFSLIFVFFGSLPYFTLHWLSTLPPTRASRILSMMDTLTWAFVLFLGPFGSVMLALVARWKQSKQKHSLRSI
jgi:hypothetical protein